MSLNAKQLAIRAELIRFRISASEIAGLLLHPITGEPMHPYESPMRIFAKRTGTYEDKVEPHQSWGSRLEPLMLAEYAEAKSYTLTATGDDAKTLVCKRWPYLAATPDAIVLTSTGKRHIAETKNVAGSEQYEWGAESTDAGPNYYRAQVMVGAGIAHANDLCDFDGDLIAQLGGRPPGVWPVDCDEATLGALHDIAEKFVKDHLIPGKKPERWEQDRHAGAWVKERWAAHDAQMKQETPEASRSARQLTYAQKRLERWQRAEAAAKALLCNEIGDALGIAGLATWKANKNGVRTLRLVAKKEG